MPSPKIFYLTHNLFGGLDETYQEFEDSPLIYVVCDALYLPKPDENQRIARDFQKVIKKYLDTHRHSFTEKSLKKIIDHAQTYFLKKYPEDQHLLKISALILVEPPESRMDNPFFYAVGIGDYKLFGLSKRSNLIFYDPETPKLPLDLSLKKRFHCLNNVIGQPYTKTSVRRIDPKTEPSLLIMSYGTYNSFPQEKWLQYASDFENKKNTILRAMSRTKDKEHLKHLLYITMDRKERAHAIQSKTHFQESYSTIPFIKLKKALHFFQWAYKIAIVLILGLCILELTNSYSLSYSANYNSQDLLKTPLSEPAMQLHLRSFKKPVRFPFIKERAFLVDLKDKYDRQAHLIDALNDRIQEQDRALRDLQIKSYYPTSQFITDWQDDEPEEFPLIGI